MVVSCGSLSLLPPFQNGCLLVKRRLKSGWDTDKRTFIIKTRESRAGDMDIERDLDRGSERDRYRQTERVLDSEGDRQTERDSLIDRQKQRQREI